MHWYHTCKTCFGIDNYFSFIYCHVKSLYATWRANIRWFMYEWVGCRLVSICFLFHSFIHSDNEGKKWDTDILLFYCNCIVPMGVKQLNIMGGGGCMIYFSSCPHLYLMIAFLLQNTTQTVTVLNVMVRLCGKFE